MFLDVGTGHTVHVDDSADRVYRTEGDASILEALLTLLLAEMTSHMWLLQKVRIWCGRRHWIDGGLHVRDVLELSLVYLDFRIILVHQIPGSRRLSISWQRDRSGFDHYRPLRHCPCSCVEDRGRQ